ncbi:translation initiation factor IF-2-like [Dermochelys coriacea]|uniref:translation initiation factor IF-2-like n=1 Tax=Dermochelys coriacea TaxID=27794 RepID=UPI001CA7C86A|nr:translation initiation factor IF-2-like [Dermochelys coriacea]
MNQAQGAKEADLERAGGSEGWRGGRGRKIPPLQGRGTYSAKPAAADPDAPSPSEREGKMQPERGLVAGRGEAPGRAAAGLQPLFKESLPAGGGRAEPRPGGEPGVSVPPSRRECRQDSSAAAGEERQDPRAQLAGGAGGDLRAPPSLLRFPGGLGPAAPPPARQRGLPPLLSPRPQLPPRQAGLCAGPAPCLSGWLSSAHRRLESAVAASGFLEQLPERPSRGPGRPLRGRPFWVRMAMVAPNPSNYCLKQWFSIRGTCTRGLLGVHRLI